MKVAILQTDIIRSRGAALVSMMQAKELDADLWCSIYDESVYPELADEINIKEYGHALELDQLLSTTANTVSPALTVDPSFLEPYDVVICHKDLSEILAYKAKKKYDLKVIWYMHNVSDLLYRYDEMPLPIKVFSKTFGVYLRWLDKKAFEVADKVFVNSRWTKENLVEPVFGQDSKIEVLHPPIRQLETSEQNKNYAIVLTTVTEGKNIERAIEEMEGRNEKLVVAGWIKDEDYKKEIEREAEEKNVDIEFTGYVPDEDLGRLISEAKFGIYPSEEETFGMVPLEMMKAGTPCFVNPGIGATEVLKDDYILPIDGIPQSLNISEFNEDHFRAIKACFSESNS